MKYKPMQCPKCGSTDRIFDFYARLDFNTVTGVNPETGGTDGEYVDIYDVASDDPECVQIFRKFEMFAHMPKEYDLAKACHVWTMPRSERIDPAYAMAKTLRSTFNLSDDASLEIAAAHFCEGMTAKDVYVAYINSRKDQASVESFAEAIERWHPLIKKDVALAAAKKSFERYGNGCTASFESTTLAVLEYMEAK